MTTGTSGRISLISGDRWPDDVRLSDIEPRFTCEACGRRGADVRPNFDWEQEARRARLSGRHTSGLTKPLDHIPKHGRSKREDDSWLKF
jgi:hypothetical protein